MKTYELVLRHDRAAQVVMVSNSKEPLLAMRDNLDIFFGTTRTDIQAEIIEVDPGPCIVTATECEVRK